MKLVSIQYTGFKPYTDRTAMRSEWAPGETKQIPQESANALLRFAEFKPAKGGKADKPADTKEPTEAEKQAAARLKEQEQAKETDRLVEESILTTVESMDKNALEAYARKYEVELDKRRSLDTLRAEVSTLIEQFGAR